MKKFAVALAFALFIAAPIAAQKGDSPAPPSKDATPAKDSDAKDAGKKDAGAKVEVDYFKIYKTKGNTWTTKTTSKFTMEGMPATEQVSYLKYEVTDVTDKKATVKYSSLDKDKKAIEGGEATFDVEFTTNVEPSEAPKDGSTDLPKATVTDEKIKVEAGEFNCQKTEYDYEGNKSTTWTSKDYPGVMVKMTYTGKESSTTSELVEFSVK